MKRTTAALSIALLAGASLAACSSGSSTSAEGSAVGGPSVCDDATITSAIDQAIAAEGDAAKVFSLDSLECKDGWAVANATVGTDEANAIGEVIVLQAEGQFWLLKERDAACGSQNVDDMNAYPADAEIPESLYVAGCTTD